MKRISMLVLALSLLAAAAPAAETANDLFQQALVKERAEGNLPEAIKLYQRIVNKYASNRKVAAQALLQLADCQSKLGDVQSRKSLERLVRDFADQKEVAAEASRRLAMLGGGGKTGQKAMRAVWTGPKADGYESSLSPDRRFISFPDWETGNLGLHDLVTGADRLLTSTGTYKRGETTAYAEASAISRDGRQVAYAWYDDNTLRYELRVLSLGGDPNPRRLFDKPDIGYLEPHDWSPDGKWISVNLWANKNTSQMGLVGTQDGSLRLLGPGTERVFGGLFSPDGKYIVYYRFRPGGGYRSYIISVDGQPEIPLVSGTSNAEAPVWTPDGSRIVFVSDRSGSPGLWAIPVAGGKPIGEPQLLKAGFGDAKPMAFARDGSLYYYVELYPRDIYLAGLDPASGKLTSEPKRVNERTGNSWGPINWLPDGKSISFWNREPKPDALVEHTLATGEEREIWGGRSGRAGKGGCAGWFPDGRTLMSRQQLNGQLIFRRVDSRTGDIQATWTLPALPPDSAISGFSPDLMTMYFSKKDQTVPCEGVKCAYIMLARDIETGRDRELFRLNATYPWSHGSISHSGREMAVLVGNTALMVAPTAGGPPRELSNFEGNGNFVGPTWTPDGSHVLALRRINGEGEIWSFPTKGGSPGRSPLHISLSGGEEPAVSPDGTQIAFVGGGHTSEIWVMTGLFPPEKSAAAR